MGAVLKKLNVKLSPEALAKVETAYKSPELIETEDDKMLMKASLTGDYGYFEEKWEIFTEKAIKPGEDDDDDEDEDDDDDDDGDGDGDGDGDEDGDEEDDDEDEDDEDDE